MTATRRLAAILAADVAGYSRSMRADEEARSNAPKHSAASFSIGTSSDIAARPGWTRRLAACKPDSCLA